MHVESAYNKCPACNCAVDVHIMHLTSLLGPGAVECHWCGTAVQTDRMEWSEMGPEARTWFLVFSFLYMVLVFFLGGLSTHTAIDFLDTGQWVHRHEWPDIAEPKFLVCGGIWVALVFLIQLYRVRCSLQRDKEAEPKPLRGSLWSFQVGGQAKVLLLLLLIPGACWLIALGVRQFANAR
jgi:hypothetical protein